MTRAQIDDGPTAPIATGFDVVPLTAGVTHAETPPKGFRALLVETGGTATLVMASGETRTDVPLQTGYNPLRVLKVSALGTASGIWGIF